MNNEFIKFPKMARLSREVIISEKIDGTNAQIYIEELEGYPSADPNCIFQADGLAMFAGSRTRWITPEKDNHGFARWAMEHKEELMMLGPGRHFGEWWGNGIQRGYGLKNGDKRFSLFNTIRWCLNGEKPKRIIQANPEIEKYQDVLPPCCGIVPVLYEGIFSTEACDLILNMLYESGSKAAPGFMKPEGIVCFHIAGNVGFKKTLENDEVPKSMVH